MKTFGKVLIVLIVVGAIGYLVSQNPTLLQQANVTGTQPNANYQNTPPPTQAATQQYQGDLTIKNYITNGLDPSVTYTDGTNVKIIYYAKNPDGSYRPLATSASNTATITVGPPMTTVWMEVSIPSGQSYLVATDKMQGTNPRMGTPTWADANADNLLAPTFPIDVTNVGSLNKDNTTPSFTLPIQLYALGTPTVNSGSYITNSNHTGVGTGSVQNIEKFTLDFSANAQAIPLMEIKLVMNDTTTTDWNKGQSYCTIPGQPNLPLTSFSENIGASTTTYKYDFGSATIKDAILIGVPKVGDKSVPMSCFIYSSLPATNNGFTVTPTFTWLDYQGATHSAAGHVIKIVA